jgi:uncharacterized repeat protein (TIGR02543 family)
MAEIVNYGHKQTAALQITTGLYPSTATSLDIRETVADMDILSQPVPVGCKLYPGLRIFVEDPPQTVTVLGKLPGADGSLWSHWKFDTILPAFKDAIDESQTEARYLGMVKPNDYTPENLLNYLFLRCHGSQIVTHKVIVTYTGLPTSPITVEYSYQEDEPYTITPQDFPGYIPDIPSISGVMGTEDVYYTVNYQIAEYALKYWVIDQQDDSPYRTYNVQYHSTVPVPETNPPRDGYTFQGWNYIGGLDNGDKMPAHNVDAKANWQRIISDYTISVTASPSNGGTVTGGGTYAEETYCTVTATANSDYAFTNWTEDGNVVSTNASYTFKVTSDRNLVANFSRDTITISTSVDPTNSGTVSGAGTYNYGDTCTLRATPATGYDFSNWSKNGTEVSSTAEYSFTVTESGEYTANFKIQQFNIEVTVDPQESGTIEGGGLYDYGGTCTLKATPTAGYIFVGWFENDSQISTDSTVEFAVYTDRSITAKFTSTDIYKVYAFNTREKITDLSTVDLTDKPCYPASSSETSNVYRVDSTAVGDTGRTYIVAAIPNTFTRSVQSPTNFFIAQSTGGTAAVFRYIEDVTPSIIHDDITDIDYYVIESQRTLDNITLLFGNTDGYLNGGSWSDAISVAKNIPQPQS